MRRHVTKYMLGFVALCALVLIVGAVLHLRAEAQVFRNLQKPIHATWVNESPMPFERFVQHLERETGVEVEVDWATLAEKKIRQDTIMAFDSLKGLPPLHLLNVLHRPIDGVGYRHPGWAIRGSRVVISTRENADPPPGWLRDVYRIVRPRW